MCSHALKKAYKKMHAAQSCSHVCPAPSPAFWNCLSQTHFTITLSGQAALEAFPFSAGMTVGPADTPSVWLRTGNI